MSTAQAVTPAYEGAFEFVKALAAELSAGKIELPGFPDVVTRVQRVLADETADAGRIVRVIGSEPVLAGKLIQMANSAALNPGGNPVTDLPSAVVRLGLNNIRSAALSFAVRQIRAAPALKGLEKPLDVVWQSCVLVASLCYVIARRFTRVSPDKAMLAGLLQGIGRLYILTRASRHRSLFSDMTAYRAIERDWHLSIATAVLENWEIAEEIVEAVRDSEDLEREPRGPLGLTDVLVAGKLFAAHHQDPQELDAQIRKVRALARLNLDAAMCQAVLHESADEVAALRVALG